MGPIESVARVLGFAVNSASIMLLSQLTCPIHWWNTTRARNWAPCVSWIVR